MKKTTRVITSLLLAIMFTVGILVLVVILDMLTSLPSPWNYIICGGFVFAIIFYACYMIVGCSSITITPTDITREEDET